MSFRPTTDSQNTTLLLQLSPSSISLKPPVPAASTCTCSPHLSANTRSQAKAFEELWTMWWPMSTENSWEPWLKGQGSVHGLASQTILVFYLPTKLEKANKHSQSGPTGNKWGSYEKMGCVSLLIKQWSRGEPSLWRTPHTLLSFPQVLCWCLGAHLQKWCQKRPELPAKAWRLNDQELFICLPPPACIKLVPKPIREESLIPGRKFLCD